MAEDDFLGWLTQLETKFSSLTSTQQTQTINRLISRCGSDQLWLLQQRLPELLYRDFVSLLPPELTERILSFLPASSLLACCQVSRLWRDQVSSLNSLWLAQARRIGCQTHALQEEKKTTTENTDCFNSVTDEVSLLCNNLKLEPKKSKEDLSSIDWKTECIAGLKLRQLLDNGKAWTHEELVNLVKSPGRFAALHYHLGHIAGGTADSSATDPSESAMVWDMAQSAVVASFPVAASVSCIRLCWPDLLVCGHFDGSLSSHSVNGAADPSTPPGTLLQRFRLHTAPVLSVALSESSTDLLVSGSADCSIKLWRLSTGELLKTLPNQSHWVLTTIICHPASHNVPRFRGRHLMLTMTRDDIQLWSWERIDDLVQADLYIPLKSVTEAIQSFFFTPGLHFDGARISFIRQMPMFDTQTIGDADIVILSAETGKVERSVHVNQKIRKLLAIGDRFAVLLLPYLDSKYKNMAVVDLVQGQIVGGATVPHSRASTPDFSQVCLGDTEWLNGFSSSNTGGLVGCFALADSSLHTVAWHSLCETDT